MKFRQAGHILDFIYICIMWCFMNVFSFEILLQLFIVFVFDMVYGALFLFCNFNNYVCVLFVYPMKDGIGFHTTNNIKMCSFVTHATSCLSTTSTFITFCNISRSIYSILTHMKQLLKRIHSNNNTHVRNISQSDHSYSCTGIHWLSCCNTLRFGMALNCINPVLYNQ